MKLLLILSAVLLRAIALGQQHVGLSQALALAREHSPTLAAARADANAVLAEARAARAQTLPQLSANGFATTGNQTSIISSSPMVEPAALMATAPGTFLDANIMLMVPIWASRLPSMASAANWRARAAGGELAEAAADVDVRVAEAYYQVLLARQMQTAARARIAAAEELFKNTQARFEAGSGIQASVSRSQSELAAAQRELTSAINDEAKAILRLKAVMGLDASEPIAIEDTDSALPEPTLDEELAAARDRRGLLVAARARVEAARAEVRAAEGQRLPQLYGVAMSDAANRRDMGGVTAGVTLSLPIFDGGRISADVSRAKAMRASAEAQLRGAQLTVETEVREASLDVDTARANTASAKASVASAEAAYEAISLRVEAGKAILVEQLDALQTLSQARADFARANFDLQLAIARLNRAAGGLK